MIKEERAKIFKDIIYKEITSENSPKIDKSIKKEIPNYKDVSKLEVYVGTKETKLYTKNEDCVISVKNLSEKGKTMLLNMASYKKPGGGVINVAMAQEEEVCRRTNLYASLEHVVYPLKYDEYVYTSNVSIMFDNNYSRIKESNIDVITIAAYNLNCDINEDEYILGTRSKIYTIFKEAYENGIDNLVLSAFGCGVFNNNPIYVANEFKNVYEAYFKNCFNEVCFSILNDNNSVSNNFNVFNDIIN